MSRNGAPTLLPLKPTSTSEYQEEAMDKAFKVHSKVALQAQGELFTEPAVRFLVALHRTFEPKRQTLLAAREDAQRKLDSGLALDFPLETANVRAESSWHCVPPAPGLEDRRVEITGPTDRKMVINALNSGAKTFMADFEGVCIIHVLKFKYLMDVSDSSAPTFENMLNGQINLRDAIRREIDFETGAKKYRLVQKPAVLIVRYVCHFSPDIRMLMSLVPGDGIWTSFA